MINSPSPNSSNQQRAPSSVPEVLDRFANMVNSGTTLDAIAFKNINKKRVDDFFYEPFEQHKIREALKEKIRNEVRAGKRDPKIEIPGVYNYEGPSVKSPIFNPDISEYSTALGPLSRFGDGDGSFWDKWILNDSKANNRGLEFDEKCMPLQHGDVVPQLGFKRYYKSTIAELPSVRAVMPYAQRRAERLEQKEKETAGIPLSPPKVYGVGKSIREANWNSLTHVESEVMASPKEEKRLKRPVTAALPSHAHDSTLIPVSELAPPCFFEKEVYFGEKARASFFDAYRSLARQQHVLSGMKPGVQGIDVLSKLGSTTFEALEEQNEKELEARIKERGFKNAYGSNNVHIQSISGNNRAGKKAYGLDLLDQSNSAPSILKLEPSKLQSLYSTKTVADSTVPLSRFQRLKRCDSYVVEKTSQVMHFSRPRGGADAFLRPGSPRTRFLTGCLQHSIAPRPHLIVRSEVTSVLNIENQYIGDTMACILANSLPGLPFLSELNVAGNKLTDIGLTALIKALPSCPDVTTVS